VHNFFVCFEDGPMIQFFKNKKTFLIGIGCGAMVMFVVVILLASFWDFGRSANYTFLQTAWNTETENPATHASNQNGWTEYLDKDSNVTAGADITLATSSFTATDDGTLTTTSSATGGGFGNGANTSTQVNGSGASGTVTLQGGTSAVNAWSTSFARLPVGSINAPMLPYGTDDLYVLAGVTTTNFYKYTISTNQWTTLASAPETIGNPRMVLNGTDLYVTRGAAGTGFYKYSISTNQWVTLNSTATTSSDSGGGLLLADGYIYFLPAGGGVLFYRYSISAGTWSSALTSVPSGVSTGARMLWDGSNGIYVMSGNSSTGFYKYSISGNSWSTLAIVPASVGDGGSMRMVGTDIYVVVGGGSSSFYKYATGDDNWSALTSLPATVNGNGNLFINDAGTNLYAVFSAIIRIYSIAGGTWSSSVPGTVAFNAKHPVILGDYIYGYQLSQPHFARYSISGNSWQSSDSSSLSVSPIYYFASGAQMIYADGDGKIFIHRGGGNNNLVKYTISTDTWSSLSTCMGNNSARGVGMIRNSIDDEIFFLGNGNNTVYKYSITSNTCTASASIGGSVSNGYSLSRDGTSDTIYIVYGGATATFKKYTISTNTIAPLTDAPGTITTGSVVFRVPGDNYIYVLAGGGATTFYRYSISGNSWETLTAAPQNANNNYGNFARYYVTDGVFYVLFGGSSPTLYTYNAGTGVWSAKSAPSSAGTIQGGAGFAYDSTNGLFYLTPGVSSYEFLKYSIADNAWTALGGTSVSGDSSNYTTTGMVFVTESTHIGVYYTTANNTYALFRYLVSTNAYTTSGNFESATIDLATLPASFGNLTWTSTVPSQTGDNAFSVQVAGKDADSGWVSGDYVGSDGTSGTYFSSSGTAIHSALNGKRYIRYKLFLATADTGYTSTLSDITIAYNNYQPGTLTSNTFNTQSSGNVMNKIAWTATGTSGTETIKFQIRSSSDGNTWSNWCGYADSAGSCSGSNYFETANNNSSLAAGHLLNIGANDQYFQYKLFLASAGFATPTVSDVTVTYTVNAAPVISNITATQGSDGAVNIAYDFADADNSDADITVYYQPAGVTLNEELSNSDTTAIIVSSIANLPDAATILIDNEMMTYTSKTGSNLQGTITRGVNSSAAAAHTPGTALFVKAVTTSGTGVGVNIATGTGKTIAWTANTDIDGLYGSMVVKVLADDGEAGNRFGSANASSFTLDTKDPISVSLVVNANKETANTADVTIAGSDDNSITMRAASTSSPTGEYETYATSKTDYALSADPATLYLHIKDAKGNITTVSSITPTTPTNLAIIETSNTKLSTPVYRLFVSWQVVADPAPGFGSYKVYRKVGSGSYALASTIAGDNEVNYYTDTSVSDSTAYTYYVVTVDSAGNVSQRSSTVAGTANGRVDTGETAGSDDQTAPTISAIGTPSVSGTTVTLTFQTNETSDSWIDYSTNLTYGLSQGVPTMVSAGQTHTVVLTGLNAFTTYYYQVRSKDASANSATENSSNSLTFRTAATTGASSGMITVEPDRLAPSILIFDITETSSTTAVINVRTDESSRAILSYGTTSASLSQTKESDSLNTTHTLSLSGLKSATKYFVKAEVADSAGNKRSSEVKNFTTGALKATDPIPPKEEVIQEPLTADKIKEIKNEIQDKPKEEQKEILTKTLSLSVEVPQNAGTREDAVKKVTRNFEQLVRQLASGSLRNDPGVLQELIATASQDIPGPQIVEGLPIIELTPTSATFYWKTDKSSNSLVGLVPDALYSSTAKEPYLVEVGNSREYVSEHTVKISDLRSATKYHYQLRSQGAVGAVAKSRDYEFITPSDTLEIVVANVTDITASRITLQWRTNVDADGQVEYTPYNGTGALDTARRGTQGKTDFSLDHNIELTNLAPGTRYALRIISRDRSEKAVERVLGDATTLIDREGPQISQVDAQSTLYPGVEAKVQTLMTWRTDEPSNSQVVFWAGLGATQGEEMKTQESKEYTRNHVVVLTRQAPGAVYQYKVVSIDESGNKSESDTYTMLAATNTENVIDVIVKNFSDIFGWLKKK